MSDHAVQEPTASPAGVADHGLEAARPDPHAHGVHFCSYQEACAAAPDDPRAPMKDGVQVLGPYFACNETTGARLRCGDLLIAHGYVAASRVALPQFEFSLRVGEVRFDEVECATGMASVATLSAIWAGEGVEGSTPSSGSGPESNSTACTFDGTCDDTWDDSQGSKARPPSRARQARALRPPRDESAQPGSPPAEPLEPAEPAARATQAIAAQACAADTSDEWPALTGLRSRFGMKRAEWEVDVVEFSYTTFVAWVMFFLGLVGAVFGDFENNALFGWICVLLLLVGAVYVTTGPPMVANRKVRVMGYRRDQ